MSIITKITSKFLSEGWDIHTSHTRKIRVGLRGGETENVQIKLLKSGVHPESLSLTVAEARLLSTFHLIDEYLKGEWNISNGRRNVEINWDEVQVTIKLSRFHEQQKWTRQRELQISRAEYSSLKSCLDKISVHLLEISLTSNSLESMDVDERFPVFDEETVMDPMDLDE